MRFISKYCTLAAFVFGVGLVGTIGVSGAPTARAAKCGTKNYGPFKLYAKTTEVDGTAEYLPLKIIKKPSSSTTGDTNFVLSVCPADDCGTLPYDWRIYNGVLSPATGQIVLYPTVSSPVKADAPLEFFTRKDETLIVQGAPDYCATRNPQTQDGLPGYLGVLGGDAENFSICVNIPTVGTPARQDVWYKADPLDGGLEKYCKKVHLVMQSTGIIADPIPA